MKKHEKLEQEVFDLRNKLKEKQKQQKLEAEKKLLKTELEKDITSIVKKLADADY